MFASVSALPITEQPRRQKISVFGRKAQYCLCIWWGTVSIKSLLPFPWVQPHSLPLPPSLQEFPCWLQGRSCKYSARQSLSLPQHKMSGTGAAPPTQSLVSLPKDPRQIQFEAASRHTLCAVFYSWLGSPSAAKVQTCMQTWFLFQSCQPPLDNNFYPPAEWVFIIDIQCRLLFEISTS